MTAKIIDFAKKRSEKKAKEFLATDFASMSPKDLKFFMRSLREHIITNAEGSYPSSIEGYTTVMINGMAYMIPDISDDDFE